MALEHGRSNVATLNLRSNIIETQDNMFQLNLPGVIGSFLDQAKSLSFTRLPFMTVPGDFSGSECYMYIMIQLSQD